MSLALEFTEWATAQGVKIDGVAIQEYPGRGFGLVSERSIKSEEIILDVPTSALHNITTVPQTISSKLNASKSPISVNGTLALSLLLSTPKTPWDAMLPRSTELLPCIPFLWHSSLQTLLPSGAAHLLRKHQVKIAQDWHTVSACFEEVSYDDYIYHWFLVSTRTFYWTAPKVKGRKAVLKGGKRVKKEKIDHDDCISLAPFADMFNHTPHGSVSVVFSPQGYTLNALRDIKSGEELSISYGNHSNDFLIAEYGFVIPGQGNEWDEARLDEVLAGLFDEEKKDLLSVKGYWGRWVLDGEGVCYRTRVAIALLVLKPGQWERMVESGGEGGEKAQRDADQVLAEVLRDYLQEVNKHLSEIEKLNCGLDIQKEMLRERWSQISTLIKLHLDRIETNKGK